MFPVSKKECDKILDLFFMCKISSDPDVKIQCNKIKNVLKEEKMTLKKFYVKCMQQKEN